MEKPSKLRVVFDRKVLNKYQRLEGLECSWVFLKPNIKTISDLQSHVQKSFSLDEKCPNGVVLYMNGFLLPPFESTSMLHESDFISVRKQDNTQIDSIGVGDKPLAITEAVENSNGQKEKIGKVHCMRNENGIHTDPHLNSKKKRRHSDEIPSPKKTLETNSKKPITEEEDEDKLTCSLQRMTHCKTIVNNVVGGSIHDHANGSVAKQSRNARRKKEKRIWLRELKAQNRQD